MESLVDDDTSGRTQMDQKYSIAYEVTHSRLMAPI